jgi:CrcB protein
VCVTAPYHRFIVSSAFLIGALSTLFSIEWHRLGTKSFLATGMMGGSSTFSSLIWGTHQMLAIPAEWLTGVLYLVFSMILGFMLTELGFTVGQAVTRSRLAMAHRS